MPGDSLRPLPQTNSLIGTTKATEQTLTTIAGGRWDALIEPELTHHDDPTSVFKVDMAHEQEAFGSPKSTREKLPVPVSKLHHLRSRASLASW